jgi:citrate lyase subunit beta/citryl-CoA lyase
MTFIPLIAPLFVPASRPERFAKAAASGADAIIIDLEDAVPPDQKDAARGNLSGRLSVAVPAFIRINAVSTAWFDADLNAMASMGSRTICVPKVETPELVDMIVAKLGPDVCLLAQIETAKGLQGASAIAAHPNVAQLAFGPADFFLDLRVAASTALTAYALATLTVASRAADKALPLDGPSFAINDQERLAEECNTAATTGAGGKLCIHPSQVHSVLKAFAPSEKEIEWARRVVAADQGGAAQIVDGQMIDAPIVARARLLLSRAAA